VTDKTQNRAGLGFVVFMLLVLASIFLLRWQPRADFDLTGVLWVMQNVLPLITFSVFFLLAAGAGIVWLQCRNRARRQPREGT